VFRVYYLELSVMGGVSGLGFMVYSSAFRV